MKEKQDDYVVVIDMGAPRNIGWADSDCDSGQIGSISCLINKINKKLKSGKVALGFETPLFLPLNNIEEFTAARKFDDRYSWSAGAGATICSISLPFISIFLKKIYESGSNTAITTDYDSWKQCEDSRRLLIWEAFITGGATETIGDNAHMEDARRATESFQTSNKESLSIGATLNLPMILAQGIGYNFKKLDKSALVVKKSKVYKLSWL